MGTFRQCRFGVAVADEETFVWPATRKGSAIKEILDCVRNSGVKKPACQNRREVAIEECFGKSTTRWRKL